MNTENLTQEEYLLSLGCRLHLTQDGSPTLLGIEGECMHHSGGAASESLYIYFQALDFFYNKNSAGNFFSPAIEIKKTIENTSGWGNSSLLLDGELKSPISVMSMGFGLGYNELITALWALLNEIPKELIFLVSYEKEKSFYREFVRWLLREPTPMSLIYDSVLTKLLNNKIKLTSDDNTKSLKEKNLNTIKFNELFENVKNCLLFWLKNNFWKMDGAIENVKDVQESFHVILYDAYSKKTNEYLWSFEFFDALLKNNTQKTCVFSTYACTSILKKAFQENQFVFFKRKGFQGKRDSSLAYIHCISK